MSDALVVLAVIACILFLGWAFVAHDRYCQRMFAACRREQQTCLATDAAGWRIYPNDCSRYRESCVVY